MKHVNLACCLWVNPFGALRLDHRHVAVYPVRGPHSSCELRRLLMSKIKSGLKPGPDSNHTYETNRSKDDRTPIQPKA